MDTEILIEKEQTIQELRETVEILELKVKKQSAHMTCVNSVAFSPDGATIVSGSFDRRIKVWDAGVSALPP